METAAFIEPEADRVVQGFDIGAGFPIDRP